MVVSTGLMFGILSFHHILLAYEINVDEVVTPYKTRGKCDNCVRIISQKKN
jgi:hypothetical protein